MKYRLNEVRKLQKVAGILKETTLPENMTINQVVKELNKIANTKGFYAVDKSADIKPKANTSGVKNLVKWKDNEDNVVELYTNNTGKNVTVSDLQIHFESYTMSGEDPVDRWLDSSTWDYEFKDSQKQY
jgi:hypothetical protein